MSAQARVNPFDEYEATVVSVLHPSLGWTDPALIALERGEGAIVLTAWNPGLARPDRSVNEAASERLRADLVRAGHDPWPADGTAPFGAFHEPGWVVWGMDEADGIAIATRYGQLAVFSYDRSGVRRTVPCP